MIVACTGCSTRFRLPDEKMRPGGVRVRCSRCKTTFRVEPPATEVTPAPATAPPPPVPTPAFGAAAPAGDPPPPVPTPVFGAPAPPPTAGEGPAAPDVPADWSDITFGPQGLPPHLQAGLEDPFGSPPPAPLQPPPSDLGSALAADDLRSPGPAFDPLPMHGTPAGGAAFEGGLDPALLPGLDPPDDAPQQVLDRSLLPAPPGPAPQPAPATETPLELDTNEWRPDPPPARQAVDLAYDPFDRIDVDEPRQPRGGPEIGPLAPGASVVAPLERSASGLDLDDGIPAAPRSQDPVARKQATPVGQIAAADRPARPRPPRPRTQPEDPPSRQGGIALRLLSAAAAITLTLLAFVVARNGGDLRIDAEAVAVAFGLAAPPHGGSYVPVRVEIGRYPTAGGDVLYVHGAIANVAGTTASPALRVVAELRDQNQVVARGVGWAGGLPSPEAIHQMASADEWSDLAIAEAAAWAGPIADGEEAPFFVVLGAPPEDGSRLRVRVEAAPAPLPRKQPEAVASDP